MGMGWGGGGGEERRGCCVEMTPMSSSWRTPPWEDEEHRCIGIRDGSFGVCSSSRASPKVRASRPLRTEKKRMELWVNSSCVPALHSMQPPPSSVPPPGPHPLLNPHSARQGVLRRPYGRAESPSLSCKLKHDPSRERTGRGAKPTGGWGTSLGGAGTAGHDAAPTAPPPSPRIPQKAFPPLSSNPVDGHPSLQSLGDRG